MQLQDAIRRRRMVRAYDSDRPVPRDEVNGLLDLAVRAPSAGFTQGWRFLVLDTAVARDAFWSATTVPRRRARRLASRAGHRTGTYPDFF